MAYDGSVCRACFGLRGAGWFRHCGGPVLRSIALRVARRFDLGRSCLVGHERQQSVSAADLHVPYDEPHPHLHGGRMPCFRQLHLPRKGGGDHSWPGFEGWSHRGGNDGPLFAWRYWV